MCVDDLCIIMKEPEVFLEQLQSSPFYFKLKGSGEISFRLGYSFVRDSTGTLCMAPGRYIDKMEDSYKQFFGEKPRQKYLLPLEKGDHPELDTTAFLEQDKNPSLAGYNGLCPLDGGTFNQRS
jgi:hypothetical protein